MNYIYTVTSMKINEKNNPKRCWAWFRTLDEAYSAVENVGDYFRDNYYDYLVIEEAPEGNVTKEYKEWWYCWDVEEANWSIIHSPNEDKHFYSMG